MSASFSRASSTVCLAGNRYVAGALVQGGRFRHRLIRAETGHANGGRAGKERDGHLRLSAYVTVRPPMLTFIVRSFMEVQVGG
jgi:hypothetical protein